jgi:flagellar basal-body rod modification protein FlgD
MATIDPASQVTNPTASLGLQDFMRILLTQLAYQDPLKPMDNQQFMSQIAQFTTLQQSQQLNEKIDQLLSIQSAVQSIGLIGKTVDVEAAGGPLSGSVTGLSFAGGAPQLTLRTASGQVLTGIPLGQVVNVR